MSARTENAIHIDAPIDLVWDITNDVPAWPHLFSEYANAEVLEQSSGYVKFRLTMHPDEEGRIWSWVSERREDRANRTVDARRVETGPFAYMNIRWTYTSTPDDGTLLEWFQDFEMKPEAPVDDTLMAERINTNSPVQLALIKHKVEQAARRDSLRGRRVAAARGAELDFSCYAGRPLVVILGNRLTQQAGHAVVDALRTDPAAGEVPIVQVAHLKGIPRSLHGTVERDVLKGTLAQVERAGRLRAEAGLPAADDAAAIRVALDWSGTFTSEFDFGARDREVLVLVVDRYLTVRQAIRAADPTAEIRAALKEL